MLWVSAHSSAFGDMGHCALQNNWFYLMAPVIAGNLGVDLFFVLSGFLITYVLMREMDKYGEIDYGLFIKSRFCRIWPMIAVITFIFLAFFYSSSQNEG